MAITDRDIKELEKLVDDIPLVSLKGKGIKSRLTKRHARSKAPAHLRPHPGKSGKNYYYYVRGADKEEYLGSADYIRALVKVDKAKVKA